MSAAHRNEPLGAHSGPGRIRLAWLAAILSVAGCGYRTGLAPAQPAAALPEDALSSSQRLAVEGLGTAVREASATETIGIKIFGNESMLPNLERSLHSAFTDAARRHASLRLVSPTRADLFIRGRIADFHRGRGARTTENQAVETLEILVIEAELVDGTTGAVLGRERVQPVVGSAIDVPGREIQARERALRNAADRLLLVLLAGLEYGVTRPGDPLLPEKRPVLDPAGRNLEGATGVDEAAPGSNAPSDDAAGAPTNESSTGPPNGSATDSDK